MNVVKNIRIPHHHPSQQTQDVCMLLYLGHFFSYGPVLSPLFASLIIWVGSVGIGSWDSPQLKESVRVRFHEGLATSAHMDMDMLTCGRLNYGIFWHAFPSSSPCLTLQPQG